MIETGILTPLLQQMINALRCLPGVGPKTAQRMAFHLLQGERNQGHTLAQTLLEGLGNIRHCQRCRNFSENDICALCTSPKRDKQLLCVVETPADIIAIEQSGLYRGFYFVLMGYLSPLDGIGPQDIGIDNLTAQLKQCEIKEIILATNPTAEGEATAHYIANIAKSLAIKTSRIAHGVPMGGELEYLDQITLSHAFNDRKAM